MNSREFFRRIEDKELRGDSYEGVNEIKNYGPGSFFIPSINHTVNYQAIHLPIAFKEVWGNIYCLFCLSPQTTLALLVADQQRNSIIIHHQKQASKRSGYCLLRFMGINNLKLIFLPILNTPVLPVTLLVSAYFNLLILL